jgi:hypothetical protein
MKMMLLTMLASGAAITLLAQDPPKTTLVYKQLIGGSYEFVSGGLISGQTVKGAPFSAEAVTETTQTLSDGNRIVQRTSSKQYRDSDGRERREETSSMGAIFISDPVAQISYTLHPDSRTAEKSPFAGGAVISKVYSNGAMVPLTFHFNLGTPMTGTTAPAAIDLAVAAANSAKTEQLGPIQMEGVVAQGTRTTTTIPAGQIGNERPINVVSERWYSPDLQMTVMTKVSDPRSGETVYKLTNIVRVEQLHSLFEIPSDYTVGADIPFRVRIPNPQLLSPNPQQ